eukprot:11162530-Alexandrium_andersonii.AAC.1
MRHFEQRTHALESKPRGAGPEGSGAASNPAGSPAAGADPTASGAGWNRTRSPKTGRHGTTGLGAGPSLRAPAPVR